MAFGDEHLDLLQNIEFAIVTVYRLRHDLSDYNVMRGLDAVIGYYRDESRGHTQKIPTLEEKELEVFGSVKAMCEFRMGRVEQPEMEQLASGTEKSLDDVLSCLRKIRKSVDKWNSRLGPQGYLSFVSEYV
jgi:hypothetical protein